MKKIIFLILYLLIFFTFYCDKNPGKTNNFSSYQWQVSTPEQQGLNANLLLQAISEADKKGFIDCILIIKNGFLVTEQYFNGFDEQQSHIVHSVSKSVLSALVGIAIREKFIKDLDQNVLDFFPEYVPQDLDKRKNDITIKHLLTMRAGWDRDRNIYTQIVNSSNWIKSTLDLPLKNDPGLNFSYNTFKTHLLSAILTKSTKMNTLKFAEQYLFNSLGIACTKWTKDNQGYYFGGNDMYFTPRDLARFGFLYLNNGKIGDEQLVPEQWVQTSFEYTAGGSWDWGGITDMGYGYLWWLGKIGEYDVKIALGFGGQFILIFKQINMIVIVNSDPPLTGDFWEIADQQEQIVTEIVADYIVPAVVN